MAKGSVKENWGLILAVVIGLLLMVIFVIFRDQVWETIKPLGRGIINAFNEMVAGRPPWLK